MNSEAAAILQSYTPAIRDVLANVILATFLFGVVAGVLTVLSAVSTSHLIHRSVKQPSTAFMLGGVLVLYASTAVHFGALVAYTADCLHILNVAAAALSSPTLSLDAALTSFDRGTDAKSFIISTPLTVNVVICDAIIWWRACAIWRTRAVMALGMALLAATLALGFISLVYERGQMFIYIPLPPHVHKRDMYQVLWAALSLLTNMTATLLIGRKAWEHRQVLRYASKSRWNTPTMKILALLVESGAVYSVFLVMVLVSNSVSYSRSELASSLGFVSVAKIFFGGCLIPVLAIYPTLIIFVVAMNRSIVEDSLLDAIPSDIQSDVLPSVVSRRSSFADISLGAVCSLSIDPASDRPEGDSESKDETRLSH